MTVLGLFKEEFQGGQRWITLTSKTYFCASVKGNKQVSKGVGIKQNSLTFDKYLQVLQTDTPLTVTNQGFMSHQHHVYTYKQQKKN